MLELLYGKNLLLVLISGLTGLGLAYFLYSNIKKQSAGSEKMKKIAENIHLGAMTFLRAEYSRLIIFVALVAGLLFVGFSWQVSFAFFLGACCSALAGFIGMKAATRGNVRTAQAAKEVGITKALLLAFNGGAVMGISVASLGLLGLGFFSFLPCANVFKYKYRLREVFNSKLLFIPHLRFFYGSFFNCSFCPYRWRYFHQSRRCGF